MPISLSNKKKMRNALFIVLIVLTLLTTRLAYIQFVWGAELSEKAGTQQSQSRTITAKRGTIYDSTGKYILAESSSVEFVSVNPTNISDLNTFLQQQPQQSQLNIIQILVFHSYWTYAH